MDAVEIDARLARSSPALERLGAAWMLVLFLGFTAGLGVFALFGMFASFLGTQRALRPRAARIRIDDEGVHADGRLLVPRDEVASVYVEPTAGGEKIVLARRGIALDRALFVDAAQAPLVLDALGRGSATPRMRLSCSGLRLGPRLLFPLVVGLLVLALVAAAPSRWVAALIALFFLVDTATVDVGVDGLAVRRFGIARFIPWNEITEVTHEGRQRVRVDLARGEELRVHLHGESRTAEIVERMARALDDARNTAAPARELPRQIDRLRHVTDAAGYRDAARERDELWRMVEAPGSDATTRARAAIALSAALDKSERARLRVAADASASPKVRVAIDAATRATSDAELDAALEEIERSEARARGRRAVG